MDVYVMNGTNQVVPVNGTNRAVPMNVVDPVTITLLATAGKAAFDIWKAHRTGKKAKAQAHTEFMNVVYGIPGLTQAQKSSIHRLAEENMGAAVQWVENHIAAQIAKQEQELAMAAATQASMKSGSPKAAADAATKAIATTQQMVENAVISGGQTPMKNSDQIAEASLKGGVAGWWAARSTTEKTLLIGGGVLAAGTVVYLLMRKKKGSTPRRRTVAKKSTKSKSRK